MTQRGGPMRSVVTGATERPPLLLINPLGATLEIWDDVVARLQPRFRVIRYDMPPPGSREPGLDLLGQDAVAVLDDHGVTSCHVAGISLGGLVALWLGIFAAARVRSLVIANSAARVGTPQRWDDRISMVRERGLAAVADVTMTTWFTPEFAATHPDAVERCRAMIAAADPDTYIACCRALRDGDLRPMLSRTTAPAVVLAGERDVSTTVADAEVIAGAIPGAPLHIMPCAHMSAVERAGEVAEHIVRLAGGL